jgi:hypothetical protein
MLRKIKVLAIVYACIVKIDYLSWSTVMFMGIKFCTMYILAMTIYSMILKLYVYKKNTDQLVGIFLGWGGGIRTPECRHQKPMPYHLATPH